MVGWWEEGRLNQRKEVRERKRQTDDGAAMLTLLQYLSKCASFTISAFPSDPL